MELPGPDGVRRVYAAQTLGGDPGPHAVLTVGAPVEAALLPLHQKFERDMLILAGVGVLAFGMAWTASDRWVLRGVRRLHVAARRLQAGDLGARAGHGDGGDEVAELATAFDAMAASLQNAMAGERLAREELAAANRRLLELDRTRRDLVNLAAHEMSTPLTPIRLQAALLRSGKKGPLTESQERALEIMERNLGRVGNLAEDVLEAARLEAGYLALDQERFDLASAARAAIHSAQDAAERAGVEVTLEAAGRVAVRGDERRLGQVVSNLLVNALKFTRAGGRVAVTVGREGDRAVVRVRDTGAGFRAEEETMLFQPFFRAANAAGIEGSGLGLYLSRGIVERHGGHVFASSDGPGLGATFGFDLPVAAEDEADVRIVSESKPASGTAPESPTP
jgi:signal transduction histidine kinase